MWGLLVMIDVRGLHGLMESNDAGKVVFIDACEYYAGTEQV